VATVLGRDADDFYFDFIGINHLGWIQDVRKGKTSHMHQVIETIESHREDGFDYDLINLYRMVPTSTVGLFYHTDRILKGQKRLVKFRAEVLHEAEQQILKLYKDKKLKQIPPEARMRNTPWYEETITPLIQALESPDSRTLVLCVRNEGAIRDLPDPCSVEVPVNVSSAGISAPKVGNCPRFLRPLILSLKESERCVIEAVRHKSYESALQALVANPLVPSVDAAREYLDRVVREEALELR
jgi:6-phospho-beta-glucosidase